MFDNETPLIAWLAVGSVYVVGGLSKQVSILRYGPLHWKAVIYHYLHWEEAGAFYRGDCRLNNKTHNIHLSIPTYEALQHRNLSSTGSRITNQVRRRSLKFGHRLKILTLFSLKEEGEHEALYIWTTNFETRDSLTMLFSSKWMTNIQIIFSLFSSTSRHFLTDHVVRQVVRCRYTEMVLFRRK